MSLNPPVPGLRPVFNRSNSVAKVHINIRPGDVLHVSDDVAGQLIAARVGIDEGTELGPKVAAPADADDAEVSPDAGAVGPAPVDAKKARKLTRGS